MVFFFEYVSFCDISHWLERGTSADNDTGFRREVDYEIPRRLERVTKDSRVWKHLRFKNEALNEKLKKEQYLRAMDLSCYKWKVRKRRYFCLKLIRYEIKYAIFR